MNITPSENKNWSAVITFKGSCEYGSLEKLLNVMVAGDAGVLVVDMEEAYNGNPSAIGVRGSTGISRITVAAPDPEAAKSKRVYTVSIISDSQDTCEFLARSVARLLSYLGTHGNAGHSFAVTFVPVNEQGARKDYGWDGDGGDYLHVDSIQVNGKPYDSNKDERIKAMTSKEAAEKNALADTGMALHLVGHGLQKDRPDPGLHVTAVPDNHFAEEISKRLLDMADRAKKDSDAVGAFLIRLVNQGGTNGKVATQAAHVLTGAKVLGGYQQGALKKMVEDFRSGSMALHIPKEFPLAYRLMTHKESREALYNLMEEIVKELKYTDTNTLVVKLGQLLPEEAKKEPILRKAEAFAEAFDRAATMPLDHVSSVLVKRLDAVASRLQDLGLVKLATEVDMVTNSVEKEFGVKKP